MFRFITVLRWTCLWLTILFFCTSTVVDAAPKNRLTDIRYWSAPTFTRIVFDVAHDTPYESSKLERPERITLTLKGFDGYLPKSMLEVRDGIVKNVRALQDREGTVRVVIELEKPANHNIFLLGPIDGKSPRLVVDVTRDDLEQAARQQREETRRQKKKGEFIVVVDPGHGGEDPGAVSKNGTQEKDLVLAIGKKLVAQLEQQPGIKAYLTRRGDYFIPLQKRIDIAKEYGADAFVSIHVNAGFSQKVSGSSVYCLSFKCASNNAARLAESRENSSDKIGGVPLVQKEPGVNAILFDMVQTHTLNTSMRFAELLLGELSKINTLHSHAPQQANFAVLRSLDIPSVLIETDFITNPVRERALASHQFQQELAKNITSAVRQFAGVAGPGNEQSEHVARNQVEQKPVQQDIPAVQTVREQRTSLGSAARTPDPSVKKTPLQKKNPQELHAVPGYRIVKKSETQYALVPVAEDKTKTFAPRQSVSPSLPTAVAKKPATTAVQQVRVHTVQKGETFFSIARRYDLPAAELKKINGWTEIPQLKIGEKIKVPALITHADADSDTSS